MDSTVKHSLFIGIVALALGDMHSILLKQDGSVWSSGYNTDGQLGIDSKFGSDRFVLAIPSGAKAMTAGDLHSIVLKQDGSVWATGGNDNGRLGDGSTTSRSTFAEVIPSESIAVAADAEHTMALKSDGNVWVRAVNDDEEQLRFMRVTGVHATTPWTLSACTMSTHPFSHAHVRTYAHTRPHAPTTLPPERDRVRG